MVCERMAVDGAPTTSFSVVWDNVQIQVHRKHQDMQNGNRFIMWAMTLAVQHRLPSLHLIQEGEAIHKAETIPSVAFLPQEKDWMERKERCVVLVKRILVTYISCFKVLSKKVTWHIPHEHSKQMQQPTKVVNLGVVEANPSTVTGAIDIMEHLHQYVPNVPGGQVHALPCNGDQLSVERMVSGQQAMSHSKTAAGRLEGLIPTPQEFHKEGILLQVGTQT